MRLTLLRRPGGGPLRIGHRGAPGLAPENTLESFEHALDLGMDGVELDVVCPDEDRLIVCHDVRGEGPSLEEVLVFFADRGDGAIVQLDVKTPGREAAIVDALRRFDLLERTVVSSFHSTTLRAVATLEPELARSLTFPRDRLQLAARPGLAPAIRTAQAAGRRFLPLRVRGMLAGAAAEALTLHFTLAGRAVIAACHARGAAVWAWTVNDPAEVARLDASGADAIITDDPRIFSPRRSGTN